jgi:hypothetical protein
MKRTSKLVLAGLAAFVLPLTSQAADIVWGSATTIVNSTDIRSTGVTDLAGADFGRANGTTTIVNNGVGETGGVSVEFKSMNGNQTVTLSNGVTVSSTFTNFNVAAGNAAPAGNYKTVLSRHMGQFGGSPTITLSGLVDGTQYQVQLFASGGDSNTVNITGGPGLAVGGSSGQYAVGTFTATGSSQVITISGGEPVMNALTIGVIPGSDTTPPNWIAGWPQAAQRTPTSLTVRARSNETGTAYYVVLATGASVPTAAQVKAGTDSAGTPAINGSFPVTANTEATAPVTGLTTGSSYAVYFVAEDAMPNLQASPSVVSVAPLVRGTTDTFSSQSATLWGTGFPGSTQVGTASSKTVHFVGTTTGVEFDVTFSTAGGNLQQRAVGGVNAEPRNYLADSSPDANWFNGPLTITVNNFTGADPTDVNFRLAGVSGQRLVTNDLDFTSTATPVTATKSLGTPAAWGALFTDLPLDSTAANMAGGSYTATLTWVNIDSESWGLYKDISFEIGTGSGSDTTPPAWTATWPQADALSTSSLTVRARTNEAGTAYYVVLPDGAPAPTAAQVKALTDSSNTPVSTSGSLPLAANTEATAPVGGLSPGTAYDVYFVAEDSVPNLQAAPTKVDTGTPTPDITAPVWIATWPKAEQLSATSVTVRAQTNETGAAYYVVLAAGASAPTAAQVKDGNDSTGNPALGSGTIPLTANTEVSAAVTGLTADTTYDIYIVAEDAVPNLQASPSLVSVSLVTPTGVTWGTWTDVSDNTAIQVLGGYSTVQGVNFNGPDTTINNGTVDVSFIGIGLNASSTAAGITLGTTGFDFQSTGGGNSNVVSAVGSPQTWGTVLDRVIGDFGAGAAATFSLSGLTPGSGYYVQFFSSAPDGNILSNSKITSRGVDSPFFGSHPGGGTKSIIATFTADGTSQAFTISGSEPTYSALVIGVQPAGGGNTYANWIGGFSGLNGLTGFNDDADADGLDNGVENFLGTAPNAGNAGLTAGTLSGNTFTFTHPQNATPASDVSAPAYTWSTDLQTFHASGATSGGITVNLLATPNIPSAGTTTVTATVTGTTPSKLFVRLGVSQE